MPYHATPRLYLYTALLVCSSYFFLDYGINILAFTLTSERLWHNLTKEYLDQSSATRGQEGTLLQPTNASVNQYTQNNNEPTAQ